MKPNPDATGGVDFDAGLRRGGAGRRLRAGRVAGGLRRAQWGGGLPEGRWAVAPRRPVVVVPRRPVAVAPGYRHGHCGWINGRRVCR